MLAGFWTFCGEILMCLWKTRASLQSLCVLFVYSMSWGSCLGGLGRKMAARGSARNMSFIAVEMFLNTEVLFRSKMLKNRI